MGDKIKILIVDDDNFLLDMYAFKFSQNNFEVNAASDGALAIEKLTKGLKPDIILTDIIMPGMNGFDVLERINQDNLALNAIKIILSNKNQQADIDRGEKLGVSGYIIKANSTPSEVIEKVNQIFEKSKDNKKILN